jgi:DNA-binding CsgD family transcriptional regulator/preprotein translocase subunit SecG
MGDVISITKGLINLAMTAVEANNFCAGLYYLNQISQEGYSHESLQSIVNNNYGYIYLHLKNYPLAIEHYLEGYKQAKSRKQVTEQLASLFYLSAIYDSIQKQDESYEFVKRYYILKDSIEGKEVIKDVEKIKWGSILKKHSSLQKNVNKAFTIIISLFLLILIVIYYLYRNKIKKIHLKIIENIKLRKYIKEKNKQHQQQLEHYSLEIETKNRELTVANLQLLEKSKTLNNIKKVISDEKYSSSSYPKEIHKVISHNENQDKDWNEFSDFLSKTHPEFFKKIQSEYNQLSKTEIRVCAYIRINMTNQEIANKLNISYRSIIKNRYRIKKKLGLNKDDNLDDFINMW